MKHFLERLIKRFRFLEFLCALWVAGWYNCRKKSDCLKQVVPMLRILRTKNEVTELLAAQRISVCERCVLFDTRFSTCGRPGKNDDMGCFCHMPTKVKTMSNCWLYQQYGRSLDEGWPRELNSFID